MAIYAPTQQTDTEVSKNNHPVPREVTHDHIRDMFIDLGLIPDEAQLYCVELLLKPLGFKPTRNVDKE